MRTRTANIHDEAHGRDLRIYDWVAPAEADPRDVVVLAERTLGCTLDYKGDGGEHHGYVNTSRLADGSLHVCVVLYEDCDDPDCPARHRDDAGRLIVHRKRRDPSAAELAAMVKRIGEHPEHDVTKKAHRDALGID